MMSKIAHRWSLTLSEVNRKRKQADQFKVRLQMQIPDHGIASCIKNNPHGFLVGFKYSFRKESGQNCDGSYSRIHVQGDRRLGIWDWVFIDNDVEFHTYFSLI